MHTTLFSFFLIFFTYIAPCFSYDVVIPCEKSKRRFLNACIDSIREHLVSAEKIYVVSEEPYTDKAIWLDIRHFPYTINEIEEISKLPKEGDTISCTTIMYKLAKLYASFVDPNMTSKYLAVDPTTIFLKNLSFQAGSGKTIHYLLNSKPSFYYTQHCTRMFPMFQTLSMGPQPNPIVGFMMFNREYIQGLRSAIEEMQAELFWKKFSKNIIAFRKQILSAPSEELLYYNYISNFYPSDYEPRVCNVGFLPNLGVLEKYRSKLDVAIIED